MQDRLFAFAASAVGFAGALRRTRDNSKIIARVPSQAPSAIPLIGGQSFNQTGPQEFYDKRVCFDSAKTEVFADYDPPEDVHKFTHGNHDTNELPAIAYIDSELCNLRIRNGLRTLSVLNVGFRLSMRNPRNGSDPVFRFERLTIERLKIDDQEILVEFPGDCDKNNFDAYAGRRASNAAGYTYGSLVTGLRWAPGSGCDDVVFGGKLPPGTIRVPDFGTIHLAEVLASPLNRKVSMLRIAAGSDDGGEWEGSGGDIGGIGHP